MSDYELLLEIAEASTADCYAASIDRGASDKLIDAYKDQLDFIRRLKRQARKEKEAGDE